MANRVLPLAQFKHLDWQPDNEQTWRALLAACGHADKAPPAPKKTERDILANLLAWCDRVELVTALGNYLDQADAPPAGLLCMTAHIENRYEIVMDRVSLSEEELDMQERREMFIQDLPGALEKAKADGYARGIKQAN